MLKRAGFLYANLNIRLRNTKEICFTTINYNVGIGSRHRAEYLDNLPSGVKPSIVNSTSEALDMAKKYGWICSEKVQMGILYILINGDHGDIQTFSEKTYKEFSDSLVKFRELNIKVYSTRIEWDGKRFEKIDEKDCLEFLRQPDSILIVDSPDMMEGFEWPNIIIDTRDFLEVVNPTLLTTNDMCRAMVQFIVIENPNHEKIFTLEKVKTSLRH